MSSVYLLLKWVHIVSSTVLFGMGAGIGFFFIRAQRTGDVRIIAAVGKDVVLADAIFTASAVVTQPVTGLAMMWTAGYFSRRDAAGHGTCDDVDGGLLVDAAMDLGVDRSLPVDRLLLAPRRMASDPDARYGGGGGGDRFKPTGALFQVLPRLVCAGLASLHWRAGSCSI